MRRATIEPMPVDLHPETIRVPDSVRFPIELEPPEGFRADDPGTWPRVEGRLEWVQGRLLYMPPCGHVQGVVAVSGVVVLGTWARAHREFVVGGNEAGMLLGHDVRGAEAGVWRRDDPGRLTGGSMRVPPILAVEVAGREEGERELRTKARWYLEHGVQVMWLVLPKTREVVVMRADGEERYGLGDRLAADVRLPGLEPAVSEFFDQLD